MLKKTSQIEDQVSIPTSAYSGGGWSTWFCRHTTQIIKGSATLVGLVALASFGYVARGLFGQRQKGNSTLNETTPHAHSSHSSLEVLEAVEQNLFQAALITKSEEQRGNRFRFVSEAIMPSAPSQANFANGAIDFISNPATVQPTLKKIVSNENSVEESITPEAQRSFGQALSLKTSIGIPTDGLVAYYPFNGNANDESGNANHGTVNGAILTTDRFGYPSSAYYFNGTTYVKGSASSFPTTERTVALWFKAANLTNNGVGVTVFGYGGSGVCGTSYMMTINLPERTNSYDVQSHCGINELAYKYSTPPINAWHHWAITTNVSGTIMYVDGLKFTSNSILINNTYVLNSSFGFGTVSSLTGGVPFSASSYYMFIGALDDIIIYNRALTAQEIVTLYHIEPPPILTANQLTINEKQSIILNTSNLNASISSGTSVIRTLSASSVSWVGGVAFNSDGSKIVSGAQDSSVKIWDTASGTCLHTLTEHTAGVVSVAFNSVGNKIVTGGCDNSIKIWNVTSGSCLCTLTGHTQCIRSAIFTSTGDRIISASDDHSIRIWNATTCSFLYILTGHTSAVWSAALDSSEEKVISGSSDTYIKIWDLASGTCLRNLTGHTNIVTSLAFSPKDNIIISGSYDTSIKIWNYTSGTCLRTLTGHTNAIRSVAFNPNYDRIISGSHDNSIKIWDVATGICLRTFTGHTSYVLSTVFDSSGYKFASASLDSTAKIWWAQIPIFIISDLNHGSFERISSPNTTITTFALEEVQKGQIRFVQDGGEFTPSYRVTVNDGFVSTNATSATVNFTAIPRPVLTTNQLTISEGRSIILSTSNLNATTPRDPDGVGLLQMLTGHTGYILGVAITPSGDRIISGSYDHTIKIWNTTNGFLIRTLTGTTSDVRCVAVSPNGDRVVSGSSSDLPIRIWNATDGSLIRTLPGHTSAVWSLAFSSNGDRIVSGSGDQTIKIWNATDGSLMRTLTGHTNAVRSVIFTSNNDRIISGSADNSIRIWNVTDSSVIQTLMGHTACVYSIVLSLDDNTIISGSEDRSIRIWDGNNGTLIHTLLGHTSDVLSVAINSQGDRLISGSFDNSVRIWDVASGALLRTLLGHTNYVRSIVFFPSGDKIVSGSYDRSVRIWTSVALSFTISDLKHGQFERISAPDTTITTFSLEEVQNNQIRFLHDGSEFAPSYKITVNDGFTSTTEIPATIQFTNVNDPPVVVVPLQSQGACCTATINQSYNFTFYANTFFDSEYAPLTYTVSQADNSTLPAWLNFNNVTRSFSGTPTQVGIISIKVIATDPGNLSVSDTFTIRTALARSIWPMGMDITSLNGQKGFKIEGEKVDGGSRITGVLDINGDGINDLIISAPGQINSRAKGIVYVIFGKNETWNNTFSLSNINGSNGFRIEGINDSDYMAAQFAGDINGDSIEDLVLYTWPGIGYVIFGHRGMWNSSVLLTALDGNDGFKITGGKACPDFNEGFSINSAGDINGDGIVDLIAASPCRSNGDLNQLGRVDVIFGQKIWNATFSLTTLDGTNGFSMWGEKAGERTGMNPIAIGDINGDGIGDIAFGSRTFSTPDKIHVGKIYIIFGKKQPWDSTLVLTDLDGSNGFSIYGENTEDQSGVYFNGIGDINNDGIDDFAIGASGLSRKVYVIFGSVEKWNSAVNLTSLNGINGFQIPGVDSQNNYISVAKAGDINADGIADFVITNYYVKKSYIIFGSSFPWASTFNLLNLNGLNGFCASSGTHSSAIGDVNADSFHDLGISLPSAVVGGKANAGISYGLFGGHNLAIWANQLSIDRCNTVVLNSSYLNATRSNQEDFSLQLSISGVSHGRFEFNTNPGIVLTNFTQGQICNQEIQFVHDCSISAPAYQIQVNSEKIAYIPPTSTNVTFFSDPIVVNIPLASQALCCSAGIGQAYNFTFLANTFIDPASSSVIYLANTNNSTLPQWLNFNATARAFSGTLNNSNLLGTLNITVTASDTGTSVADTFALTISPTLFATHATKPITYIEDTQYNFTSPIVITTPSSTVNTALTLSNPAAGNLLTGTSGKITSTYNLTTGTWQASGALVDVNALLVALKFQPVPYFHSNFTIAVNVNDIYNQSISETLNVTGIHVNHPPTFNASILLQATCSASSRMKTGIADVIASANRFSGLVPIDPSPAMAGLGGDEPSLRGVFGIHDSSERGSQLRQRRDGQNCKEQTVNSVASSKGSKQEFAEKPKREGYIKSSISLGLGTAGLIVGFGIWQCRKPLRQRVHEDAEKAHNLQAHDL